METNPIESIAASLATEGRAAGPLEGSLPSKQPLPVDSKGVRFPCPNCHKPRSTRKDELCLPCKRKASWDKDKLILAKAEAQPSMLITEQAVPVAPLPGAFPSPMPTPTVAAAPMQAQLDLGIKPEDIESLIKIPFEIVASTTGEPEWRISDEQAKMAAPLSLRLINKYLPMWAAQNTDVLAWALIMGGIAFDRYQAVERAKVGRPSKKSENETVVAAIQPVAQIAPPNEDKPPEILVPGGVKG